MTKEQINNETKYRLSLHYLQKLNLTQKEMAKITEKLVQKYKPIIV